MSTSTLQFLKGPKGQLPGDLWTCLPPILQEACGYFDRLSQREAFLHGTLPILSRICENVVVPLADDNHRLAIHVYVYGTSGGDKGAAEKATRLLKRIRAAEEECYAVEIAKWKAEDADEQGLKRPEPERNDMSIALQSTPNTWVREMKKNPPGVVHLIYDTEGDTLKGGGYKEHGSIRPMIKKGYHGEEQQFTLKEDGTVSVAVWLSALCTSTPKQMKDAIIDTEDGFAARFIYHKTPPGTGLWDDVFGSGIDSIGSRLESLGLQVQNMHNEHRRRIRERPLRVTFNKEQKQDHQRDMQRIMTEAYDLHPELHGFVVRLSHSVLRTAALFAVLRAEPPSTAETLTCDTASYSAAAMLRTHWEEGMFEAFNLLNPSAHREDGRMTVPEDVKEYVCRWRLDHDTMPQQAVMKLQTMDEPHIRQWLKTVDNPADAVGKIQRKYLKDLQG